MRKSSSRAFCPKQKNSPHLLSWLLHCQCGSAGAGHCRKTTIPIEYLFLLSHLLRKPVRHFFTNAAHLDSFEPYFVNSVIPKLFLRRTTKFVTYRENSKLGRKLNFQVADQTRKQQITNSISDTPPPSTTALLLFLCTTFPTSHCERFSYPSLHIAVVASFVCTQVCAHSLDLHSVKSLTQQFSG